MYIDDVLVASKTFDEHLQHICEVFLRLRAAYLWLKPKKCGFLHEKVPFLGHIIHMKVSYLAKPSGKLARWALTVQKMDVTIRHKSRKKNSNADALSHCPADTKHKSLGERPRCR